MENHHQKTNSRDTFSFPSTPSPDPDYDFEFGCLTPDSRSTDPYRASPADHLFFNGRLLPHSFPPPSQPAHLSFMDTISRGTSRTSSVSSKDCLSLSLSLKSSRSNSVNSSRSSVSSARTSSSDNSDRRKLLYYGTSKVGAGGTTPMPSKVVMAQLYGSSQRWQHIVPGPVLKREESWRRNGGESCVKEGQRRKKKRVEEKKKERVGFCWRFLWSFLVACRECHAMEPSTKDEMLRAKITKL